jgi:hypothetical protein
MTTYNVEICRIEHTVYTVQVQAPNEETAETLAMEIFSDEIPEGGEIVHGEEFAQAVYKAVPNETN